MDSSQRGQCIFICQPRNKERDTKGSLIDYESHKIKRTVLSTTVAELYAFMKCYSSAQFYRGLWMDMAAQPIEVHLRTDANNLATMAASTRLPEQKETIHMIQMLRQEACHWARLSVLPPLLLKIQKGTEVPALLETGGKSCLVSKESLTGRCFISATGPDGTRTTSTTLEKPLPSLEVMTGFHCFETHGGSRLSDYWQQKTKSRLSRARVTPRKTLFTPSQCPC